MELSVNFSRLPTFQMRKKYFPRKYFIYSGEAFEFINETWVLVYVFFNTMLFCGLYRSFKQFSIDMFVVKALLKHSPATSLSSCTTLYNLWQFYSLCGGKNNFKLQALWIHDSFHNKADYCCLRATMIS